MNKLTLELDHRRQTVFSVPGAAGTADFGCLKLKLLSAFLENDTLQGVEKQMTESQA